MGFKPSWIKILESVRYGYQIDLLLFLIFRFFYIMIKLIFLALWLCYFRGGGNFDICHSFSNNQLSRLRWTG
jgi:hypothetical protein